MSLGDIAIKVEPAAYSVGNLSAILNEIASRLE